jgi:diguanylate cyclase (GGDEF)-like protein
MAIERSHQVTESYNDGLVVLSVLVAILASYTALDLAGRASANSGRDSRVWQMGGALALGVGIWAMHFIGMLALTLPIPVSYDLSPTAGSLALACIASFIALRVLHRDQVTLWHIAFGALAMGAGIVGMHYIGMAAMPMSLPIRYDAALVASSILIAVLASGAAISTAVALRSYSLRAAIPLRVGAAVLMGIAIAGMHYTGMAAAHFDANAICLSTSHLNADWLATTVGLASSAVLTITLMVSVFDARLQDNATKLVSQLRLANAELQHRATHDQLTGLANRALSDDRLEREIAAAARSKTQFAVMFIDLDRFKTVNDSLGHQAGDTLLTVAAHRLKRAIRLSDSVARVGGDEFVLLLRELRGNDDAVAVARKLMSAMAEPLDLEGVPFHLSISVGIAMFPADGTDSHTLLASADAALTSVKRAGRGRFSFFTPDVKPHSRDQLEFENDLREAISKQQLTLYYQPKIDVISGAIVGAEALARWFHPKRGSISPVVFIKMAEDSGLIEPLGRWVLQEACRQNRQWIRDGLPEIPVSVNLSAFQFRDTGLPDQVGQVLFDTSLSPHLLELELTESTVMEKAYNASEMLQSLVSYGVRIAVDDFGTGYSSLSYLDRFPLHTLKIDRSFIDKILENSSIVQAIVSLAHSLNLNVVAEGVETEAQLAMLRRLGCNHYQGFLKSPAVSAADFAKLLRREQSAQPVETQV